MLSPVKRWSNCHPSLSKLDFFYSWNQSMISDDYLKYSESLIDEETLITKLLRELQAIPAGLPQHHCNTLKSTAMSKLSNLSPYWRDKVFRKLVETKSSKLPMLGFLEKKAIEFQEAQRWEILELFLDSFIPVYTHFEG
jgi:hypothetical protein